MTPADDAAADVAAGAGRRLMREQGKANLTDEDGGVESAGETALSRTDTESIPQDREAAMVARRELLRGRGGLRGLEGGGHVGDEVRLVLQPHGDPQQALGDAGRGETLGVQRAV